MVPPPSTHHNVQSRTRCLHFSNGNNESAQHCFPLKRALSLFCPLPCSFPLSFPHRLSSFMPSLSLPLLDTLSLTSSHFSVCISYYLLLLCLLPQLIKWYHRTGFICIWLRGFSAVGCMFIKWLCVEGCNEPILLQSSSLPILGGDYVFIRKKENRKAQLLEHGVWGWVRRRESGSDSGKGLSSVRSGGREG